MEQQTILAMYSGGLDSLGMTYKLLTDPKYKDKKAMIVNLLKHANFDVQFPEQEEFKDIAAYQHLTAIPSLNDTEKWRRIDAQPPSNILKFGRSNGELTDKAKPFLFYTPHIDSDPITSYNTNIYNDQIRINYIDSIQYLQDRREGKPTFRPFKKYVDEVGDRKNVWRIECNNGHLCTESKLFAYAKYNNLKVQIEMDGGLNPVLSNTTSTSTLNTIYVLLNQNNYVIQKYYYNTKIII